MLHVLSSRIQVIYHHICVGLVTRSENHDLEILSQTGEELSCAWTDVERRDHRPASSEVDGQLNLMWLAQLLKAMDKGFIKIEDYCNLTYIKKSITFILFLLGEIQRAELGLILRKVVLGQQLQEKD